MCVKVFASNTILYEQGIEGFRISGETSKKKILCLFLFEIYIYFVAIMLQFILTYIIKWHAKCGAVYPAGNRMSYMPPAELALAKKNRFIQFHFTFIMIVAKTLYVKANLIKTRYGQN